MESLLAEILEDLTAELKLTEKSDIAVLSSKIKNAYREVKRSRNYPNGYSDENIVSDMGNYYSNIRELSLYDYNQFGAEGQTSHSEGGYSRTWKSRRQCFDGIVPFCRIL